MEQAKIDRINFLARKKKSQGLTETEIREQARLRQEYLDAIRENFRNTLESIEYADSSGGSGSARRK